MLELTAEQQRALANQPTGLLHLLDPSTQRTYVLVSEEMFENVKPLLQNDSLTEEERRTILQGVWKRAGWDDPKMDEYDSLLPPR